MGYYQGARDEYFTSFQLIKKSPRTLRTNWSDAALPGISTSYSAGEILFRQADPPREILVVDRGLIKLTRLDHEGQEVVVGLRASGAILGAAAVIVGGAQQMTATTLTDCVVRRYSLQPFLKQVRTDPELNWSLIEAHSRELWEQAEQLADLKHLSARQRFERLLCQLVELLCIDDNHKTIRLPLPLKFCEIAQLIGVTPEHLSRLLKQVEEEGLVRRDHRCLIISDYQSLYQSL